MAKEENKAQAQGGGVRKDAKTGEGNDVGYDVVDETAKTVVYPADLGYTVTSHGDGTPSISPQLVERRAEVKEFNASPDRENEAVAKRLGLL